MNRIDQLFKRKKNNILSVFFTAGFPSLNDTVSIAVALEKAGVDMIEIGIPFSDPVADGPVIQESNKIALDNGMNLKMLLMQLKEIRKQIEIPILLMGYINPVYQYGVEKFCNDAADAGADGVIIPDLPLADYENDYKHLFERRELHNVFLIAPTTSEERIRAVDNLSSGFVYAVSSSSTTGKNASFTEEQISYFKRIKALYLRNPFLIGFGISTGESFAQACEYSSGAIVGSAFIHAIKSANDLSLTVKNFVHELRGRP